MSGLETLKRIYGRLIRAKGIGPFVAVPVRFIKALFRPSTSRPSPVIGAKIELLAAAGAAIRNDMDAHAVRLSALEHEIARLQLVVRQQSAVIEALEAAAPAVHEVRLQQVIDRDEFANGDGQEIVFASDGRRRRAPAEPAADQLVVRTAKVY